MNDWMNESTLCFIYIYALIYIIKRLLMDFFLGECLKSVLKMSACSLKFGSLILKSSNVPCVGGFLHKIIKLLEVQTALCCKQKEKKLTHTSWATSYLMNWIHMDKTIMHGQHIRRKKTEFKTKLWWYHQVTSKIRHLTSLNLLALCFPLLWCFLTCTLFNFGLKWCSNFTEVF